MAEIEYGRIHPSLMKGDLVWYRDQRCRVYDNFIDVDGDIKIQHPDDARGSYRFAAIELVIPDQTGTQKDPAQVSEKMWRISAKVGAETLEAAIKLFGESGMWIEAAND